MENQKNNLTKEMIDELPQLQYEWNKRVYSKDLYDLYLTVGNILYRVASYNVKQKRIILNIPEIWVPEKEVLEKFIKYVNQSIGGNKNV